MCISPYFQQIVDYFKFLFKINLDLVLEQQKHAGSSNADKILSCQYAILETTRISAIKYEAILVSHTRSALSCRVSSCRYSVLHGGDSFVYFGVQTKPISWLFSVTFHMFFLHLEQHSLPAICKGNSSSSILSLHTKRFLSVSGYDWESQITCYLKTITQGSKNGLA